MATAPPGRQSMVVDWTRQKLWRHGNCFSPDFIVLMSGYDKSRPALYPGAQITTSYHCFWYKEVERETIICFSTWYCATAISCCYAFRALAIVSVIKLCSMAPDRSGLPCISWHMIGRPHPTYDSTLIHIIPVGLQPYIQHNAEDKMVFKLTNCHPWY